jgi:hypothetical protein
MNYCVIEHQNKAKAFVEALRRAGHRGHRRLENAKFLLIDHEWKGLFAGHEIEWREPIIKAGEMGIPIFVYPHSARPNIPYDLTDKYYPINTQFVFSEGHREVLERIGYPYPVEVIGWTYTDIKPFERKNIGGKANVLFAPIHPVGNVWLSSDESELNGKVFRWLLELLGEINLTVRYIGKLDKNGLWVDQRVKYHKAIPDGSTTDIERADVVIGAFTLAYMTVALGKPLVMLGEGGRPHNSPRSTGKLIYARNWEKYKDFIHYPFNVEECRNKNDFLFTLSDAMQGSWAAEYWKKNFIGEPFDSKKFVGVINEKVRK